MAFTDSIKWNGKSIRDLFTEITHVSGRGKPPVEVKSVAIPGRHGRIAFKQTYKPRIIEIEGTIEGVSHATLMSNIENLKSLFAMEDETVSPGEESITDGFKYGRLEFGDESDRHYNAVFDSVFELRDISHQWMRNEMKLIRARFRCDEPFAISNALTEATMTGNADEFKVFSTGNVQSKPIIELSGAVTNPMLIEGDKVGVAHFDYNDNLSDVTLSTISGNFSSAFGYRTRKSLASQQSKAIQITGKDLVYFDRGTQIRNENYINLNTYQGTIIIWVKPYFDGDDGLTHGIFQFQFDANNRILLAKNDSNNLFSRVEWNNVPIDNLISVTSANFTAGEWHFIALRWDINNAFDGTNFSGLQLDAAVQMSSTALGTPQGTPTQLRIGVNQAADSQQFDGLLHYQLFERALTDTEISDLRNSGAGVEPYVTPDTKLLSAGELSSGDPVAIQYPWVDNKFTDGDQENNPSAEWSKSDADITLSNESTIIKYDTQSAKIAWAGFAPVNSYAHVSTGTLVNNQDYFYRFWIYVDKFTGADDLYLDIVGNSTVHTRRLNTGTDDMGTSYAEDVWLYFEGTFEADGAVAHEFRFRKDDQIASAIIYIDQMDCQVSLVNNSSMEGTYVSGLAPGWTLRGAPTPTEENSLIHSGMAAQKLVNNSTGDGIKQTGLSLVTNTWYTVSIWAKGGSGGEDFRIRVENFTGLTSTEKQFTLTTDYQKLSWTFKISSDGTGNLRIGCQLSGTTYYIDDVFLIKLDTVTANASSKATTEIDSYSQEKFGYGLRLDGGDTLSWSMTGNKNEGSVICWLKPKFGATWADETDDPVIYELQYDTNNYLRLSYDWTNDKFIFRKRAAGVDYDAEAGNQTFEDGELLSVIASYGSTGVRIYINGVLGGVLNSNAAPLTGNPGTLYLSDNTQTQFPDAIIDEICLLSRELSATEALKYSNQSKPIKNNNAKISLTKTLSDGDKLLIDSEKETIEFADSSADSFTNAIASMDAGSFFPNMDSNESVLFNKVANAGIKLSYNKKWL